MAVFLPKDCKTVPDGNLVLLAFMLLIHSKSTQINDWPTGLVELWSVLSYTNTLKKEQQPTMQLWIFGTNIYMWANPSIPQHFSQMCSAKLTIIYQYVQRPVLGQKLCSKSSHRLEGGKVKLHEHHCEQGRRTFKCTITHAWTADLDHVQTANSLARSSLTWKYYGNGLERKKSNVKTGMVSSGVQL